MSIASRSTADVSISEGTGGEATSKSIKFGIISQESPCINPYSLITEYFKYSKPKTTNIKNDHYFEFIPDSNSNLTIILRQILELDKIYDSFSWYNFFLLFIDIQTKKCLEELEKTVDCLIEAGEKSSKKCYVLGFFEENSDNNIPEEKINTILDAKGIYYEYVDINAKSIEEFAKVMEYIIMDSCAIIKEKILTEKNSELNIDQSTSHCTII